MEESDSIWKREKGKYGISYPVSYLQFLNDLKYFIWEGLFQYNKTPIFNISVKNSVNCKGTDKASPSITIIVEREIEMGKIILIRENASICFFLNFNKIKKEKNTIMGNPIK